jgi:Trypsin-like peptidase domain
MAVAPRERFVVQILRRDDERPVGLGTVVATQNIVTCAHVINAALKRELTSRDRPSPDVYVWVDFPLGTGGPDSSQCRVISWSPPPAAGKPGDDVAGLAFVANPLPQGTYAARFYDPEDITGLPVSVFGYPGNPPRKDLGSWSSGRIQGRVGRGFLQMDTTLESAIRAQPGYSGSPVITRIDGGDHVIGHLNMSARTGGYRDSYVQSASNLAGAWPTQRTLGAAALPTTQAHLGFADWVESLFEEHASGRGLYTKRNLPSIRRERLEENPSFTAGENITALWLWRPLFSQMNPLAGYVAFTDRHIYLCRFERLRRIPYRDILDFHFFEGIRALPSRTGQKNVARLFEVTGPNRYSFSSSVGNNDRARDSVLKNIAHISREIRDGVV